MTATLEYNQALEVKETYQSEAYGLVAVIELPRVDKWLDPWLKVGMSGDELMPASILRDRHEYPRLISITKANLEALNPDSIAHLLEDGTTLVATSKAITSAPYTRFRYQKIAEDGTKSQYWLLAKLFKVEDLVLLPGLPETTGAIKLAKEEPTFSF